MEEQIEFSSQTDTSENWFSYARTPYFPINKAAMEIEGRGLPEQ